MASPYQKRGAGQDDMRANKRRFGSRFGFTLIEACLWSLQSWRSSLPFCSVPSNAPANRPPGSNAKTTSSKSRISMHQFHDATGVLPPGHQSLFNRDLMPFSGWPVSVLPFVEQQALADQTRRAFRILPLPWFDPPHVGIQTVVPAFICPSDYRIDLPQISGRSKRLVAFTSYLGVSGKDSLVKDGVLFSRFYYQPAWCHRRDQQHAFARRTSAQCRFAAWVGGSRAGNRTTSDRCLASMILGVREPNLQAIVSGSKCGPGNYPFMAATGFDDPAVSSIIGPRIVAGRTSHSVDASVRFLSYSVNDIMPALATPRAAKR